MPDSTDASSRGTGTSRRDCAYCPMSGADVCVGVIPSVSGTGHSVYAHRTCADERGIPALYTLTADQTGSAS